MPCRGKISAAAKPKSESSDSASVIGGPEFDQRSHYFHGVHAAIEFTDPRLRLITSSLEKLLVLHEFFKDRSHESGFSPFISFEDPPIEPQDNGATFRIQ